MVELPDTYAWFKELKSVGFTEEQADVLVRVFRDMFLANARWMQEQEDERRAMLAASLKLTPRSAAH